jgi:long-chain acyl-CoA synthetase
MIITEMIYRSLSGWGARPAMVELSPGAAPVYLSAEDFRSRVDGMKDFLGKSGVGKNCLAALFLDNSFDFAAMFLALIDIGAKPVPVNTAFRSMELEEIFSNARPGVIIAESRYLERVRPYLSDTAVIERGGGKLRLHRRGEKSACPGADDIGDNIASINYTYRGFGYPLGAMVPHGQYLHGAEVLASGLRPGEGESMLVILPYTYIFPLIGCLIVPLLYGITSMISTTLNPLHLFNFIREHDINIITAVPEVYELLHKLFDRSMDLPSLSVFVSGGSVLSKEMYGKIRESFNVEFLHGYGLTEFTPVCRNRRGEAREGTIGPICEGIECRIMSPAGEGPGEIAVRTADMTRAYYRRPDETREAFDGDWFKTGDTGIMKDGHLVFHGVKKGTRKFKGNMVDLEEVRKALLGFPNVHEAEVECRDNILMARIGIDPGKNFDEEVLSIKTGMEDRLARYKIPKEITRM